MTIEERNEILKDVRIGGYPNPSEQDLWQIAKLVEKVKNEKAK